MSIKFLVTLTTLFFSQIILAGVTITGTRIIFPSNQKVVTVQLNNPLNVPALIQGWLDDGDPNKIPEANKVPFILTPPLVQIDPQKGQMIRLIAKGTENLAKDRESLYWFNILDIPPVATDDTDQNKLQVSIRSRIKLFYRPTAIKMSQDKAFSSVQFKYINSSKKVSVYNPSPYYINFYDIDLNPEKENFIYDEPFMVAPYSTESFEPKINFTPSYLKYNVINDYGSNQPYTATIESVK